MECNINDTFKIIALYQQYPCLWEYRNPDYKRVDLKRNAWEEIAAAMDKTVEEVKKKMKHLRSAYVGEKKKVDSSKSGSGADDVYRPHLFYYNEFSFLDSVVVLRKTTSNFPKESSKKEVVQVDPDDFTFDESQDPIDADTPDSTLENSQESTFSTNSMAGSSRSLPSSTPVSYKKFKATKRARTERDNKFNDALDAIVSKVKNTNVEEENMFSAFGRSVALQLAQLPIVAATTAMAEMQNLLAVTVQNASNANILEAAMQDADIRYEYESIG